MASVDFAGYVSRAISRSSSFQKPQTRIRKISNCLASSATMNKFIELPEGDAKSSSQSIESSAKVATMTRSKDNPEAEGKPLSQFIESPARVATPTQLKELFEKEARYLSQPFDGPARVAPMTKTKIPTTPIPQYPKPKELLEAGVRHQLRGDNTLSKPSLALAKPSLAALLLTNDADVDAHETDLAPASEYISQVVHQSPAPDILKASTTAPDSIQDELYQGSQPSATPINLSFDPTTIHAEALAHVQSSKRKSDESPALHSPDRPNKRRNIQKSQDPRADVIGEVDRDDPKELIEEVYLQISESHIALNEQNHESLRSLFSDWVSPGDVRAGEHGGYIIVVPQSENRVERALKCFDHFKTRRFKNELIQMKVFSKNAVIARFDGKVDDWVGDELLASLDAYLKKD